jgi:hypothetical protein
MSVKFATIEPAKSEIKRRKEREKSSTTIQLYMWKKKLSGRDDETPPWILTRFEGTSVVSPGQIQPGSSW